VAFSFVGHANSSLWLAIRHLSLVFGYAFETNAEPEPKAEPLSSSNSPAGHSDILKNVGVFPTVPALSGRIDLLQ